MFHYIANITADNHRPGMPEEGYVVRYGLCDTGWRYQRTFTELKDAQEFAASICVKSEEEQHNV